MNARFYAAPVLLCVILSGCLFKPVNASTRHFTLAPIPASTTNAGAADGGRSSVGIGFVKMPSYLLRNSMALRNGANEIDYLEDAVWTERLDELFQRVVADNLADFLPSDSIYLSDWARDQVSVAVHISVEQFDVDVSGHGTLIAQWRIMAPGSDVPLKSGRAHLEQAGPSPRGKPEVIAATMSDLAAQFSRDLAQAIRESRRL